MATSITQTLTSTGNESFSTFFPTVSSFFLFYFSCILPSRNNFPADDPIYHLSHQHHSPEMQAESQYFHDGYHHQGFGPPSSGSGNRKKLPHYLSATMTSFKRDRHKADVIASTMTAGNAIANANANANATRAGSGTGFRTPSNNKARGDAVSRGVRSASSAGNIRTQMSGRRSFGASAERGLLVYNDRRESSTSRGQGGNYYNYGISPAAAVNYSSASNHNYSHQTSDVGRRARQVMPNTTYNRLHSHSSGALAEKEAAQHYRQHSHNNNNNNNHGGYPAGYVVNLNDRDDGVLSDITYLR